MEFVVVNPSVSSKERRGGYAVARRYIDRYAAIDFIAPVQCDYFNHLGCSQVLTFDTIEHAQRYIEKSTLIPNDWKICKYNATCNTIEDI